MSSANGRAQTGSILLLPSSVGLGSPRPARWRNIAIALILYMHPGGLLRFEAYSGNKHPLRSVVLLWRRLRLGPEIPCVVRLSRLS
jgi:hypothetical protein